MLADPKLEARARVIASELRCLVCQNQSIDDSDAPLAKDLRLIVREKLKEGASDAQVRDFVVARYGDFVLLRPPVKPETLLLWAAPLIALIGGAFAIYVAMRRGRRRSDAAGGSRRPSARNCRRSASPRNAKSRKPFVERRDQLSKICGPKGRGSHPARSIASSSVSPAPTCVSNSRR